MDFPSPVGRKEVGLRGCITRSPTLTSPWECRNIRISRAESAAACHRRREGRINQTATQKRETGNGRDHPAWPVGVPPLLGGPYLKMSFSISLGTGAVPTGRKRFTFERTERRDGCPKKTTEQRTYRSAAGARSLDRPATDLLSPVQRPRSVARHVPTVRALHGANADGYGGARTAQEAARGA